jgi:hypothetical protein
LDLVVSPRHAIEALLSRAPVGAPLAVLGGASALLLLAQGTILGDVVRGDPLSTELPGGPAAALRSFWILRVVAMLAAPLGLGLHAATLASCVHAAAAILGGRSNWRCLLALCVSLEVVSCLETACWTAILWLHPPASLEALRDVRLRAGLDLLWEPGPGTLRRLVGAANGFTIWWAALLAGGLERHLGLRRRAAIAAVLPLWASEVLLRGLLQPR